MAKLRGEKARTQVDISKTSTPSWQNIAGEMSTNPSFSTSIRTANTKDNDGGWSKQSPGIISGTYEITAKYPTDTKADDDLVYKDFFTRLTDKSIVSVRFVTPVFSITAKMSVMSVNVTAANQDFVEYTVSLKYSEKPTYAEITA